MIVDVFVDVFVDVQDLEVVNNAGNVKRVRPQDIRGKRNSQSRRAFVVDTQQNQLEVRRACDLVVVAVVVIVVIVVVVVVVVLFNSSSRNGYGVSGIFHLPDFR